MSTQGYWPFEREGPSRACTCNISIFALGCIRSHSGGNEDTYINPHYGYCMYVCMTT